MSSRRSLAGSVALFLFGPVIAAVHFSVVYLLAETSCATSWLRSEVLGVHALVFVTIVATAVAAAATGVLSVAAFRGRRGAHGDLVFAGFLLGTLFSIEILFVGIPPAFLRPC